MAGRTKTERPKGSGRTGSRRAGGGLLLSVAILTLGAATPDLPRRVLVVSFDGAGGLDLERKEKDGLFGPDGFARARREGLSAERLQIVTPSLTAVSHASLSAGSTPARTGIVGNYYHSAGTILSDHVLGLDVPGDVETIWEAAARQGKRVASITWPGVNQREPRTSTPVGLRFNDATTRGTFWSGPSPEAPFKDLAFALPLGNSSYSPPKTFEVWGVRQGDHDTSKVAVRFVAVDGSDDGRRNYDELLVVSHEGAVQARCRVGAWFSISERSAEDEGDSDVLVGLWGKVLALSPDLSHVALYLGVTYRNFARPADFRRTIDKQAGFWPGPPDSGFLEGPSPDTQSFVEQSARFSRYFLDVFEIARRRGDWDLLMAYQPIIDEAEHALFLVDPEQPGYTRERAERAAGALREVWKIADRAAASYLSFTSDGDVVIVSDHGMRAVSRVFSLQECLRQKGWLKLVNDPHGGLRLAPDSPAFATTGGGTGFITINRKGVVPGGVVSGGEAESLILAMSKYFRDLKDERGTRVFSVVATRTEMQSLGLDHPSTGDLVVIAGGSTALRAGIYKAGEDPRLLVPAERPGDHGYDPDPRLDGIFLHVGEGIAPRRIPTFREVDVAGRIAERLGISFGDSPR